MGTVYLAFQEKLERPVALKVLLPSLSEEKDITQRFLNEAKIGAQLQHSNIVSIYDVGEYRGLYYFAMEYLEISLKEFINANKDRRLKPEIALDITKQIGNALDYAHKKGVIHRDIKPANILLRNDGTPVLVDFGIAKLMDSSSKLTKTGTSVGTPHYMSPEQIQGLDTDGRADIYGLGVVFYEMLQGRPPYEGTDSVSIAVKHIQDPIPRLDENLCPYQPILEKMMAKNKKERFQTGQELANAIQKIQLISLSPEKEDTVIRRYDDLPVVTAKEKEPTVSQQTRRFFQFHPLFSVAITALVLLLAISILIFLPRFGKSAEKDVWNIAAKNNTIQAYESYVKKYPEGQYVKLAESALSDLRKSDNSGSGPAGEKEKAEKENQYLQLLEQSKQFLADREYQTAMDFLHRARVIQNTSELDQLEEAIKSAELSGRQQVRLRKEPLNIDINGVQSMMKKYGFFDTQMNKRKGFKNLLILKTLGTEKVVLDRATGLMWHRDGSAHYMNFSEARSWISGLNRNRFAGLTGWRLPTLEEAASLLEFGKNQSGMHINPLFSDKPRSIWTSDSSGQEVWIVYFDHGYVDLNWPQFNSYVRPVRDLNSNLN
jgi:serine/threonine protein kinase